MLHCLPTEHLALGGLGLRDAGPWVPAASRTSVGNCLAAESPKPPQCTPHTDPAPPALEIGCVYRLNS